MVWGLILSSVKDDKRWTHNSELWIRVTFNPNPIRFQLGLDWSNLTLGLYLTLTLTGLRLGLALTPTSLRSRDSNIWNHKDTGTIPMVKFGFYDLEFGWPMVGTQVQFLVNTWTIEKLCPPPLFFKKKDTKGKQKGLFCKIMWYQPHARYQKNHE